MANRSIEAATLEEWFWDQVDFDPHDVERCWPWLSFRNNKTGYGSSHTPASLSGIRFGFLPHRMAYELTFGWPEELALQRMKEYNARTRVGPEWRAKNAAYQREYRARKRGESN